MDDSYLTKQVLEALEEMESKMNDETLSEESIEKLFIGCQSLNNEKYKLL